MAVEYLYIQVLNRKVVKIDPAGTSTPAFNDLDDYDVVLNRLYEHGWEPTNPTFQPGISLSIVRLKREGVYSEPPIPPDRRVAIVHINASPEEFDDQVNEMRRLYEVNGWDFVQLWERGGTNFGASIFFSKPLSAPDAQPFIDPNKPKG